MCVNYFGFLLRYWRRRGSGTIPEVFYRILRLIEGVSIVLVWLTNIWKICYTMFENVCIDKKLYLIFLIRCSVTSTQASTTLTTSTKTRTLHVRATTYLWTPILTSLTIDNNVRTLVTSTQTTTVSSTPHSTTVDNQRQDLTTTTTNQSSQATTQSTSDGSQSHDLTTDTTTEQSALATTQSTVTSHDTSTQQALSQGTTMAIIFDITTVVVSF